MIDKKNYDIDDAIVDLQKVGIPAILEFYGFSAILQDATGESKITCGFEFDGSCSLCFSVNSENNQWFVGPAISDIVQLIYVAHEKINSKQLTTWVDALNSVHLKDVNRAFLPPFGVSDSSEK